jgi:TRAP-type transport system small permease protein
MYKVLTGIEKVLTTFSVATVLLMVCLTTIDAAGRYLFNFPIQGAYEVTEKYLMVVSVFFALTYGYRHGCNIRVTFLVSHFPPQVKLLLRYTVQILSIVYGILLVIGTFVKALRSIHERMQDAYGLPLGPGYLVAPLGLFVLTLWLLYDLGWIKEGKSGLFAEEEDATITSVT